MSATTGTGAAPASKVPTLKVGSRVEVPEKGRGTVRFVGAVKFSSKDNWVGIELDVPNGNHDGAVKGVRYFKCTMNHGLFVTKDKVMLLKKVAAKPAAVGSLPVKSPASSKAPSPAPSAPSSPRGEPAASSPAPTPVSSTPPSPTSTAASPSLTFSAPAEAEAEAVEEKGEKAEAESKEEPALPAPTLAAPAPRPTTTTTSTPSTPSTSSVSTTPAAVPSTPTTTSTPSRPLAQAALPLSAESTALFTTLQELSEFKKDAQQKLKALQKSLDEVTKDKDAIAKELEREKKDRDKQIAKMQRKWEDEKEQLQKAWDEEKEEMTDEQANLSETLEMMTLDKELAEEKAESLEKKLEKIKIKFKIDSLGDDDEDDDDSSGTDEDDDGRREKARESGDDGEKAVLQLQIQRLTDALMKLKDLSVMEKKESEKKIRQLERENDSIPVLEEKIVKLKDDVKKANEKIEQLKEQLDVALEAEDMVEELSDKKLELEEQVQELQQTVEDLEQLQQVSEELEENHAEVEKQLRTALYKKEIQYLESLTKIKNQQGEIEDREKTIDQFREKVNSLQLHVKQYEEKEEGLASEARQLSTKSQALLDQNIQLKSQVTKVAAMGLERELFRLDVLQARKQLSFIQAFLPEEILSRDNESLLLLLTLDRLVFKSKLLMGHLQSYYKLDQLSFNLINDVEVQYTNDELLFAWELYWGVSKVRFYTSSLRKVINDPSVCPPEVFVRSGRAALDLLPYEGTMDIILQLIKKEELNHNYDISLFRSVQDKMSRLVNQYILEEGSALNDSSDGIPLRRQLSARGTGVAALCPPEWKSLRHEVGGILFVENVFLVLYNQLRSLLKTPTPADGATEAASPRGTANASLAIPIRLVRDAIEVCRKLQKHLQEKPSLPRHYASKLERNMVTCFTTISGAIEVFRQLFVYLRSTATGQDSMTKDKEIRSVLPDIVAKVITDKASAAEEEDMKDLEATTAVKPSSSSDGEQESDEAGQEPKAKEKERSENEAQEQEDGPEEKGSEWKWLSALLEETYSSIVGVSDKILNSSNFINPDASINITPLSTPNAASSSSTPVPAGAPAAKTLTPYSSTSFTPASGPSAPNSPSLRATESQPSWKQRADAVRAELAAAASVRSKLIEAEVLAQERLVKLGLQENEIKEHISRYNVLQMHLTALQKKEAELSEKMEKQTAEHVSQEKMYEDAMETIQKENEQLRQQIRSLRVDIRHLENAKKEAEEQRSELPSLEVVSVEIKALKRALVLLRRQNSELLAREGQKRLRTLLPPISDVEARCAHFTPLQQQLQQDQNAEEEEEDLVEQARAKKRTATIAAMNRRNAEAQQFLAQIQSVKAASKVIDLTLSGTEAPSQQWANRRLAAVKLEAQCKQVKEKLGAALLDSHSPAKITSDFASFPSAQLSKTLLQAQPVGKLALPQVPMLSAAPADQHNSSGEVRTQMQDLLARLKHGSRTRVTLNPRQLQHVHSLVL